jgi:hypothetical protein
MHNTYHTLYKLHIESHRIDILRDKVMASLDEFVAEMGAYADEIVMDSGAVEIDLEEETEFEFKDRLINLLQKSVDGNDLFVNCLANFPNSCKFFGLTLSMNRAIKSMISQSKLPAEASVGWKKLPPSMKVTLQSNFQSLLKGSKEWNALISILLKFEKPKATKKSFRVPTTQPLDSMSRLCRNNMTDSPREYSDNIIEKFTLTQVQYRTIASVHNSNVGHFGP